MLSNTPAAVMSGSPSLRSGMGDDLSPQTDNSANTDTQPLPPADAFTPEKMDGEAGKTPDQDPQVPCVRTPQREMRFVQEESVEIKTAEEESTVFTMSEGSLVECEITCGTSPSATCDSQHGPGCGPPDFPPALPDVSAVSEKADDDTWADSNANCSALEGDQREDQNAQGSSDPPASPHVKDTVLSATRGSLEDATEATLELAAMKALVARLQDENRALQKVLQSRRSPRRPAALLKEESSSTQLPSSAEGAESVGPHPTHRAATAPPEKHEDGNKTVGATPQTRRGKAPGAPPRGPPGRGPVAGPSLSGTPAAASKSAAGIPVVDASFRLWGWCQNEDSFSSLRHCCADHLLLEGSCASNTSKEGAPPSDGAAPDVACPVTITPGPMEVAWLLDLEHVVRSALEQDAQNQQQGFRASRQNISRCALKSFVEEIGFSGICLSALRRGCPDRLNFFKRLQTDILQCTLNPIALELLLELVPDMSVPSDRRQLWIDAQRVLTQFSRSQSRPFNDEEAFAAFVLEFGDLRQRLELLQFLNGKHMEAQLSSLLVVKLDCLAMLRRRAPRLALCVKAVARAASVVSGFPQGKRAAVANGGAEGQEGRDKENASQSVDNVKSTENDARASGGSPPLFRWPLLFRMVEKHCGCSSNGRIDRSLSLIKVIGSHIGNTLDNTELSLLKRAAQKPLAFILSQQASLVRVLLLLHHAASHASSTPSTDAQEVQEINKAPIATVVSQLLRCCHSCRGAPPAEGKEGAGEGKENCEDLLLTAIPKFVISHKAQLEALARLVAQLLREYATFVCWMGDRESFLPVQLSLQGAGSSRQEATGPQGPPLPTILAACLSAPETQKEGASGKLDAFECLHSFLEKLSHQAEPTRASRHVNSLLDRKACLTSSGSSSPHSSSTSSLLMHSPDSSPESRTKRNARCASSLSSVSAGQLQHEAKVRCLQLPSRGAGETSAGLKELLSRVTASLRPPTAAADCGNALRAPKALESSAASGCTYTATSTLIPREARISRTGQSAQQLEKAGTPQRRVSPAHPSPFYSAVGSAQKSGSVGRGALRAPPEDVFSFRGLRRVFPCIPDAQKHTPTTHRRLIGLGSSIATPYAAPSTTLSLQEAAREAAAEDPAQSLFQCHGLSCGRNPSEFSGGSFASVFSSGNQFGALEAGDAGLYMG